MVNFFYGELLHTFTFYQTFTTRNKIRVKVKSEVDHMQAEYIMRACIVCPIQSGKNYEADLKSIESVSLKVWFVFLFFFSFGREDDGKEVSSGGGSYKPFICVSKQSTKADPTARVTTEAQLAILSLSLEVLFPFHCLQRETTETRFVKPKGVSVNASCDLSDESSDSQVISWLSCTEKLQL